MKKAYPSDINRKEYEQIKRETTTSMLTVDSKSIQNADTAGECGYDAGKKSGRETPYRGGYTWTSPYNHSNAGIHNRP